MINALTLCLACWLWFDEPPKPEPNFLAQLITRHDMSYDRTIRVCCLDNTKSRPMYYFKFEKFPAHVIIGVADKEFFEYDSNLVETDSAGRAVIIAFVKPNKQVPSILDMKFAVNLTEEIKFGFRTRDDE